MSNSSGGLGAVSQSLLVFRYDDREADTLGTREYEEWIGSIGLSYAILGAR